MAISCIYDANGSVVFTDNLGTTRTVAPDWPGLFRSADVDGGGVVGFLASGGVIAPYAPAPIPAPTTTPYLYATAQLLIANSDIASMSISSRLSGAFRFDVGQYWVFFTDDQPDTQYMALAYDSGSVRAYVAEADKFASYFIISTTDFSGNPVDPDSINLEIKRVQ